MWGVTEETHSEIVTRVGKLEDRVRALEVEIRELQGFLPKRHAP